MESKHFKKNEFSILGKTDYCEIDNYLLIREGFNIKDNKLNFDIETQSLINNISNKYKYLRYRFKYKKYSKFFSDVELENSTKTEFNKYNVIEDIKNESYVRQIVPIGTRIAYNENESFLLNNYVLNITYDIVSKTKFNLPNNPSTEFLKENGNIVNYISGTNTLLFNTETEYLNIKDIILNKSLKLYDKFEYNVLDTVVEVKNALVYNEKVIGTIENINKVFLNNNLIVNILIGGIEIDISNGIQANMKNYEDMIYYETLDQLISSSSFEEFYIGDLVYFQDVNNVFVCTKDKLVPIDIENIVYDNDMPEVEIVGKLWFNIITGVLSVFDGDMWKQLNASPISNVVSLWNIEKKLDLDENDAYLEVFGFNDVEEFKIIEMTVSNPITKDIQFRIEDTFVESVYINGEEIFNYYEATYGIHLFDTIFKGDLVQIVVSKNKNYEWVNGIIEDDSTILITHPFEVSSVKKLVINNRSFKINNIENNRIKISDIINTYDDPVYFNKCDRIKAQVKLSSNLSKSYPSFNIEYTENLKEVKIPFNLSETRFDNIMIFNNGEKVLVNPQVIIQQDRLYAYYNPNKPDVIGFSRYIRKDDNVTVQFMSHIICDFNPDTFFEVIQSEKDILNKVILDGFTSFEDDTISLKYYEEEIDNIINKKENEDDDPDDDSDPIDDNYLKTETMGAISLTSSSTINNEKSVDDIIKSNMKSSNPDYTEVALMNKSIASNDNILVKPSSTEYRPIINTYVKRSDKYSNYNLEFTKKYFEAKDRLKDYLDKVSDKFSEAVKDLSKVRDSLRSLVNYICNTLCLSEVLRFVETMFKSIVSALNSLFSMSLDDFTNKMSNLISKVANSVMDTMSDILSVLGLESGGQLGAIMQGAASLMNLVSNALNSANSLIDGSLNKLTEGSDLINSISGLFNLFDFSMLGLLLGNFFGKIFKSLMQSLSKLTSLISSAVSSFTDMLSKMSTVLSGFDLSMFKNFTLFTNLANLIDFICKNVLESLLNLLDALVDILDYLQKRFQDLIDSLFADRYRCKWSILDRLQTCGDFFKSHVDICESLRDMMEDGDMTLAGFVKRTTNLEKTIETWKKNKKIIKEALNESNTMNNNGGCLMASLSGFESSILAVDELFGNNSASLDKLVRKLKKAFIPTFKNRTESVLDVETMSNTLFNKSEWVELKKKVTWL